MASQAASPGSSQAKNSAPTSPPAQPDNKHQENADAAATDNDDNEKPAPKPEKARRTRRPPGSGFETFYVDPPVTPAEHHHEKTIVYHPHLPFPERIEECIQRWRARRRLDPRRAAIFSRYLATGGVDSGPRPFAGIDRAALEAGGLTKDDIRRATAVDTVNPGGNNDVFYTPHGGGWEVDFAGVAAGFFSRALLDLSACNEDYMADGVAVVENFLNYVLHHDVCPELRADVLAAKQVCRRARDEMFEIPHVQAALPGLFNTALLGCCCDTAHPASDGEVNLVLSAARAWGDEDLAAACADLTLKETRERRLEILEVHRATRTRGDNNSPHNPAALPIGRLVVRDTFIEDGFSTTVLEEEWKANETSKPTAECFSLWIDDHILGGVRVGQKMGATVAETVQGVKILGDVIDFCPTYYVFLPQGLMTGWKRPVASPRAAPTVETATDWLGLRGHHEDQEAE